MGTEQIRILKKIPLFQALSESDLQKIAAIIIVRRYKRHQLIFHEGEPGEAMFFVKSGKVKIYKTSPDGREQILHFFKEGDVFAEVVLFDGGYYPANAEVIEDAEVGMIRNTDLDHVLRINGDIALSLLKLMSRRLKEAQNLVRDLALKDTYARTCSLIWKLACQEGKRLPGGIRVDLDLSRQELASMIGTSRETFTRVLSDLHCQKIILLDKEGFTVLNEKRLQDSF